MLARRMYSKMHQEILHQIMSGMLEHFLYWFMPFFQVKLNMVITDWNTSAMPFYNW